MPRDKRIMNAEKRSEVHRKSKREKAQEKLKRRMEIRKAEKVKGTGEELKRERLAKNIPRTLENTRVFDSNSYLTADPKVLQAAAERAAAASKVMNGEDAAVGSDEEDDGEDDDDEEEEEEEEDDDEEMPEAGPSTTRLPAQPIAQNGAEAEAEGETEEAEAVQIPLSTEPPKIMITTSPSPCKATYAFCDDLKNVFPGGEFFKRPRGRGYELGRIGRWAAKRGFGAVIVVNEDHKAPNAITLMRLPAGPTAYFRLSSIQLGSQIYGHAKPSPHSPELILNNFTTLLGHSVGRVFGSLFPPLPQFKGRQVVTLHNQRDFLFFRRHRYMFNSPTSAKLQEIGPRFTLKLRWLRKGLPGVTAPDGSISRGGDVQDEGAQGNEEDEKMDEDEALREMGKGSGDAKIRDKDLGIPALDEEEEYEWKWKPKMEVSRRTFFL